MPTYEDFDQEIRGAENAPVLSIHVIFSKSLAMWVYLAQLLDKKIKDIWNEK